ncbi:MAG: ATP-binding domain-containing protein, partial [Leucobacter sp.]|nr:ATP-binding domain-containing protein [Leucobacter sp.]
VQLERRTKQPAQTIAQFLVKRGQYLWGTGAYVLSTRPPETAYRTVIIDEASMLTEEQLAATLSAFSGVERLILVGDPRQLPPIGAGRPFVDIVNRLKPPDIETSFPRVGPCYAELTIRRRVKGKERDDVLLAEWFSGQPLDPGADQIWGKVVHTQSDNASPVEESDTLRLIQWTTEQDLHDKLIDAIMQELGLAGRDDLQGFERAIGGSEFNGQIYFHPARNGNPGAAEQVERWQILSPVNGRAHGVKDLNRVIQRQFRRPIPKNRYWSTPDPIGDEEIVYGDKVINTSNHRRPDVYPPADALGYIANGEIGIVVGQYKGSKATYKGKPRKLEVEFSSQPGFKYGFWGSDFSGESTATLELAYAVTIHKAQGSEFGTTFLVLPHPLPMMSRELLYTALTRQQRRVVILHQGDLTELKRFDSVIHSETARRQTNLFAPPRIIEIDGTFLEASLIHRTSTGIAVRSKSEVIIADRLDAHGIPYAYEQPLPGFDDTVWYPDFTIDDAETGNKVFWEHLGLLHDPEYRSRWERKRAAYRAMGIISRDEAEGSVGTLVVTRDDERGGINAQEIDALIVEVFGR